MSNVWNSRRDPAPERPGVRVEKGVGLLGWAFAGLVAGSVALLLDSALGLLTGGSVGWNADIVGVYVVTGVLASGFVALAWCLLGWLAGWRPGRYPTRRPDPVEIGGLALALPYLVPLWERLDARLQPTLVAAALTSVALTAWLLLLRRLSRSLWTAAALTALTASTALAVNGNLLDRPLAPASLAADAAILLVVMVLAVASRRFGPGRTLMAAGAVLAAATGVVLAFRHPATDAPPPATATAESAQPAKRHNIILLTVDTLRHDVFSRVLESTPEGRAFRDEFWGSAFFPRAVAPSPWTAPSVATLMTGLQPAEHGYGVRTDDRDRPLAGLASDVPTVAEGLRAAGYRTEAYVANPLLFRGSGIERGFDVYRVLRMAGHDLPWMRIFTVRPELRRATGVRRLPYLQAESVVDVVERRLASHGARRDHESRPLFLWVHFMDPHRPYVRHDDLHGVRHDARRREPVLESNTRFGRYEGEVRYVVRHSLRLVEALRDHGLWNDELVIFTSDHGEMFPQDGHEEPSSKRGGTPRRSGHGHSLHAEVVDVPLWIRPPLSAEHHRGRTRGHRRLAHLADVPATLEDLVGIDLGLRRSEAARSLAPWLQARPPRESTPRAVTLSGNEWGPPQRGLILGHWKLIHFPGGQSPDRLFYTFRDQREQFDLLKRRPDEAQRMRLRLAEEWAAMREPPATEAGKIDAETRERLEALGYLTE